ncbi:AAA family ATPase [Streptomyces sp. 8N616]|uniref:AAA family ATPase n=1 Tax=Streptomyces sp. 8N616 TaxID=3457414 RepID=UPI003FD2E533
MTATYDDVHRLVRSGANVLHVASFEWERVRGWCIGLARDLKVPLEVWSSSTGLLAVDADGSCSPQDEGLTDPIEAMLRLRDAAGGGVLLMEDVHPYLEPQHHQIARWIREMCRLEASPRRLLVLSTPLPGLPVDLQKEVPTVELPLPGTDDLAVVAEHVAEQHGVTHDQDRTLLEAARGLTVMEARLAFGQAAQELGRLGPAAVPLVVREKERVIRQSQVLEYYEPDARMTDVGGLENLKVWLDRRGRAFGAGARAFGLDAPKGVLLLGVQGCGKSLVAKAVAAAWQFPLLRFDLGKVFGGIVGQSEGNIRSALQVAQALAPCVLWIDEIEKGLAGMGSSDQSDGGTTARVVGTLLTWMQEKRDPVFVVATANRIEMLPPELLRKGRFDEIFFVDLPTLGVRKEIIDIHLRKKQRDPADFDLDALASEAYGYSGAELEEAVREGLVEAFAEGKELRTEHIDQALKSTFPLSRTMGEQIGQLRQWARVRARLASPELPEQLPADTQGGVPRLRQETGNPFIPGART